MCKDAGSLRVFGSAPSPPRCWPAAPWPARQERRPRAAPPGPASVPARRRTTAPRHRTPRRPSAARPRCARPPRPPATRSGTPAAPFCSNPAANPAKAPPPVPPATPPTPSAWVSPASTCVQRQPHRRRHQLVAATEISRGTSPTCPPPRPPAPHPGSTPPPHARQTAPPRAPRSAPGWRARAPVLGSPVMRP